MRDAVQSTVSVTTDGMMKMEIAGEITHLSVRNVALSILARVIEMRSQGERSTC